jgi:hypothetical protein
MAAARIAITPSALEKKLSPLAIKQFRSFASRQCVGVWVLHLQLALNQPSQHHPFSRAFRSFYVMNPMNQRLKTTTTAAPNAAVSLALLPAIHPPSIDTCLRSIDPPLPPPFPGNQLRIDHLTMTTIMIASPTAPSPKIHRSSHLRHHHPPSYKQSQPPHNWMVPKTSATPSFVHRQPSSHLKIYRHKNCKLSRTHFAMFTESPSRETSDCRRYIMTFAFTTTQQWFSSVQQQTSDRLTWYFC